MPTQKHRLNLSLTKEVEIALTKIAHRDSVPKATKALELLIGALEINEDEVWNTIAQKRGSSKATLIAHKDVWL